MMNCPIHQEMAKKNQCETAVFDGNGGPTVVSSEFHIVHTYDSHHIKGTL